MVDLSCHAAREDELAAPHRQLIRSILGVDAQGQLVVRQLLSRTGRVDNQRHSDNRDSHTAEQSATHFRHGVSLPSKKLAHSRGPCFCGDAYYSRDRVIWTFNGLTGN